MTVVDWQAGQGDRGTKVLLLQRGLLKVGYAVPVTGYYDWLTANAVNAFRKNGMTSVYSKVFRRQGAYRLRYPKAGKHGVRLVASGARAREQGQALSRYHTSSGTPATPTVFGTYRFYLQTPGTNAKGMVHPRTSSAATRSMGTHRCPTTPRVTAA